jgi:hypothetical protein
MKNFHLLLGLLRATMNSFKKLFLDHQNKTCGNRRINRNRRNLKLHRGKLSRGVLTLSFAGTMFSLPAATMAGADQSAVSPSPNVIYCPASGQAYEMSNHFTTKEGIGTVWWTYNAGSNQTTKTVSQTFTHTYGGTITGTVGGNWNFLIAQINAQLSITVEQSYASTVSVSEGLTIPSHDYGIVQQAILVNQTTGTYGTYEGGAITNSGQQCPLANAVTVTTTLPITGSVGTEVTGTATSPTPPWPQG